MLTSAYYAATEGVPAADLLADLWALLELRRLRPRDSSNAERMSAILRRLGDVLKAGKKPRIDYRRSGLVLGEVFIGLQALEDLVERLQVARMERAA